MHIRFWGTQKCYAISTLRGMQYAYIIFLWLTSSAQMFMQYWGFCIMRVMQNERYDCIYTQDPPGGQTLFLDELFFLFFFLFDSSIFFFLSLWFFETSFLKCTMCFRSVSSSTVQCHPCVVHTIYTELLVGRRLCCSSFRWVSWSVFGSECPALVSPRNGISSYINENLIHVMIYMYMYIATTLSKGSLSSNTLGTKGCQSMATHSRTSIRTRPWECTGER